MDDQPTESSNQLPATSGSELSSPPANRVFPPEPSKQSQASKVVGKNKIRDNKILKLYAETGMTMYDIGKMFGISCGRVQAIVTKNAALHQLNVANEKLRRINKLHRLSNMLGDKVRKNRDSLDVLEALREEMEGKNGSPQVNVTTNVSVNMTMNNLVEKLHANRISNA